MISFGRTSRRQMLFIGRDTSILEPLHAGGEQLKFSSSNAALHFLRGLSAEPGNMTLLRRVFAEDTFAASIFDKRDHQILEQLAWRVVSGHLKVTVVTPPPAEMRGGGELTLLQKIIAKAPEIKHLPSPIIPPEYIILARKEANETLNDTRRLVGKLNELLFLAFNPQRALSLIAREYPGVAELEHLRIGTAAANFDAKIGGVRFNGFDKTRPLSDLAPEYVKTAEIEHKRTSQLVASFGYRVDALRHEKLVVNRRASAIAPAYNDVVSEGARSVKGSIELLEETVSHLRYEASPEERIRSSLAEEYRSVATSEEQQVKGALHHLSIDLKSLLFTGTFDVRALRESKLVPAEPAEGKGLEPA